MSKNPRMVEGKVVVVTGSGGGIGRDIALAMAREGARLVVNDVGASVSGEGHDIGPAQKVVDEIRALGGEAVASTDSVSEATGATRIVQAAVDTFGRDPASISRTSRCWKLRMYGETKCEIASCRNGNTRTNSRLRRSGWRSRSEGTRRRVAWAFPYRIWATGRGDAGLQAHPCSRPLTRPPQCLRAGP